MRYCLALLLGFMLLLGGGCGEPQKLVIVSTNDIHSAVDNFPALATLVESYRADPSVSVLVVDAGDRWTGSPYVDMAPEQYKPVIDLMNAVGFDIATFGNHEWDNGINLLAKRMGEAGFVNVLTNARAEGTPLGFEPYRIIEIDGLKIGFTGMVTTDVDGHPDGKLENFGGMEFFDPFETALEYAGIADSVGLYILISHLGFTADSLLTVARSEIDLIIGGHSHTVIPETLDISGTVVTQTGKSLAYAGITEITHRGGRVEKIANRLVALDTVAHKPEIAAMVAEIKNEPYLAETVGRATAPFDRIALMNLFSDAMRDAAGADMAFHNMGGMRIGDLPQGDITKADVYSAEPFGNTVVTVEMTLTEIAQLILNKFHSAGKASPTLALYP
ncbi:MAG: bifunctional metallophosphatase/5'-nucleotidase, partial [Rikenellaceae bacterium]|nr:bifunctional metallophosphatase/5'-nucleotidase [Rikenellaceae bacterium]